jgi:hypothetical protein
MSTEFRSRHVTLAWITPLCALLAAALTVSDARAGRVVDRLYRMGDDSREKAVVGNRLNNKTPDAPFQRYETIDGAGTLGGQQIVNMRTSSTAQTASVGVPTYMSVTDRPDLSTGQSSIALQFVGTNREHLFTLNALGTPSESISSTAGGGTLDYSNLLDRGFQFWTKPTAVPAPQPASAGGGFADAHIVMDTNNHGAILNIDGKFTMRYSNTDYVGVGAMAQAVANQWYHVMVVRPSVPIGFGNTSVMYVNGVAVSAAVGDYQREPPPPPPNPDNDPDSARLTIGANSEVAAQSAENVTKNYFSGIVDDLEMFVMGLNGSTHGLGGTGDFGLFDFASDNAYAARFKPGNPLDLAGNDNQITIADVTAFAVNWQYRKVINGVQVGDLETVARGDFNYDGIVDLSDWERINDVNPAMAAAAMSLIQGAPEPSTLGLSTAVALAAAGARREMAPGRRVRRAIRKSSLVLRNA